MPAVSHLDCDARVARLAEGHEVFIIVAASMGERQDVVDLFCRSQPALLPALLA